MKQITTLDDINKFLRLTEEKEGSTPPTVDKKVMKSGDISTDQLVEKLNTIRSGKSFKDSSIKRSLQEYIDSLEKAEKVALFAFLKGIAQIVTGEIYGSDAVEPADPIPAVTMKKGIYKRNIKPTIIKKTKNTAGKQEDTTPPTPTPIKPKS